MFNKIRKIVVNFSIDQETQKKNQIEILTLENIITKIKNEFNSTLDTAKERLSEPEARFKNIQR